MNYALWIPSWYPSRVDNFAGDFIERHAKAAALFIPLHVIFIVKDPNLGLGITEKEERLYNDNSGATIYYYGSANHTGFLELLFSFFFQLKLFAKAYNNFIKLYEKPSLIHLQVAVKYSWIAWWWSVSKNIPLVISEQWTGYLKEANHEWLTLKYWQKWTLKKAFAKAVLLTTVSKYLAENIALKFDCVPQHVVIPNVVDTSIFKPDDNQLTGVFQFIHISTLSFQKNFNEILQACSIVKKNGFSFQLVVYGSSGNQYQTEIENKDLSNEIILKGEASQSILAKDMASSNALILYSLYETFGCVIIEANACGIPCIVSDIPAFEENVSQNSTGIKVPLHRPDLLSDCMVRFIKNEYHFERNKIISATIEKYCMEKIGKLFADEYRKILSV